MSSVIARVRCGGRLKHRGGVRKCERAKETRLAIVIKSDVVCLLDRPFSVRTTGVYIVVDRNANNAITYAQLRSLVRYVRDGHSPVTRPFAGQWFQSSFPGSCSRPARTWTNVVRVNCVRTFSGRRQLYEFKRAPSCSRRPIFFRANLSVYNQYQLETKRQCTYRTIHKHVSFSREKSDQPSDTFNVGYIYTV